MTHTVVPIISVLRSVPPAAKTTLRRTLRNTLAKIPKRRLAQVLGRCDLEFSLGIHIVGAQRMRRLNYRFRKHDRTTDVLSFPQLVKHMEPFSGHVGDALICWPVARAQARRLGVPLQQQLCYLATHGLLHLFGYDHERGEREARSMFALQDSILQSTIRESLRPGPFGQPPARATGLPGRSKGRPRKR